MKRPMLSRCTVRDGRTFTQVRTRGRRPTARELASELNSEALGDADKGGAPRDVLGPDDVTAPIDAPPVPDTVIVDVPPDDDLAELLADLDSPDTLDLLSGSDDE